MRVLICGSRGWKDRRAIRQLIRELPYHAVVIHGAHWSGADKMADEEAKRAGLRVEPYPARWKKEGLAAGPNRNSLMLRKGKPEFVFAFRSKGKSAGTDDCVKKAKGLKIPTYVIPEGGDASEGLKKVNAWEQLTIT